MKTKELLKQNPVYLHDWSITKRYGVICDFENIYNLSQDEYESKTCPSRLDEKGWLKYKAEFEESSRKYKDVQILFATYMLEGYEGSAWILFYEDGKLYEVNGGHCSCYGLEGQWHKEEVELVALKQRLEKGTFGTCWGQNEFAIELKQFISI